MQPGLNAALTKGVEALCLWLHCAFRFDVTNWRRPLPIVRSSAAQTPAAAGNRGLDASKATLSSGSSATTRMRSTPCARPAGWPPRLLDYITPMVEPGVTTGELDRLCHTYIVDHGAVPAPLNYRGFPKSICTSVNHVVCHGIPGDRKKLANGDCVNIDVTVILDGWHGDTSRMFFVGDDPGEGAAPDRGHLRGDDARHRGGQARRHAGRYRHAIQSTPKATASPWCAISAATASAGSSTTRPACCITASAAPDRS